MDSTTRKSKKSKDRGSFDSGLIGEVSSRMRLKEGEEAVRRIIREVYRHGKIGTKDLARAARLPTPVAAAIRRELEKEGVIARKGGAILTEAGKEYAVGVLGMVKEEGLIRTGEGSTEGHKALLEKLTALMAKRPRADPTLDQSHGTPETALKRALYMLEEGDLAGREVVFLGDDDFTSIAAGLLGVAKGITVIDIDARLLEAIAEASEAEGLGIECVRHDLRDPLPVGLRGRFDSFLTDPPYTVPGLSLFFSRGIEALRPRKTASAYLAFADKPPLEMLRVHRAVLEAGLYVEELIPRFNVYEGAEILANTTFLAKLRVTEEAKPTVSGTYGSGIYTGELRPTVRTYRCRCGERIRVGSSRRIKTIEALKAGGCPKCGAMKGFRLLERKEIKRTD